MYISVIICAILYVVDIISGYFIAGPTAALIMAAALPIGVFIQMKLAIFQADATKLDYLAPHDKECLALAFENVLQRGESFGYTFRKNPKIYLSEDEAINGFSCGNAIVINRGAMQSGCLEGIVAHEIKHWKFLDSYVSCLLCNTITILSLLTMFVLNIYIFAIALFIGILISVFGNGTVGILVGSFIGKILGKTKDLILRANLFLMNAFQSMILKHLELKADEFAVRLGYAEQLKQFLRLTFESRKMMSLSARLLSSHPSDSNRIGNIQKIQNQLEENGKIIKLPFNI